MDDLLFWILIFALVAIVVPMLMQNLRSKERYDSGQGSLNSGSKAKMAEDIKATQTSRVADQIEILDELAAASKNQNYRQYCELVGTSQAGEGVTAPYSRRQVAYYDIRCYRIDRVGGQQTETLVAHERSIDPFYFKDASSDEPIYVDLESFGGNVLLVNSTNHVEGPNSDFAKAVETSGAAAKGSSAGRAMAAVAHVADKADNLIANLRARAPRIKLPSLAPQPAMQLAFAGAGAGFGSTGVEADDALGSNMLLATKRGQNIGSKVRPSGKMGGSNKGITINVGGFGMPGMPQGLGSFLGGSSFGFGGMVPGGGSYYGHYGKPRPSSSGDLGGMLMGMALSSILDSLSSASTTTGSNQNQGGSGFLGYRLVEDIVPLNSPVYCIGELYRQGTNVYMGRSTSEEYSTSFFATKPESEVLANLGK